MHRCILEVQRIISNRIDSATAHLLQHSDMYAVENSEPTNVQVRHSVIRCLGVCVLGLDAMKHIVR